MGRGDNTSPPKGGEQCPPPACPAARLRAPRGLPTPTLRAGPPKGGCAPLGLRPAPRALLRVGRAAPRPPGLRPLCALQRTGPGRRSPKGEGLGRGGLSPLSAAIGGNTRQARIACEIPLPLGFLKNGCLASEARQAEGEAARGQLGWEKGHVVKPGVLQACPHVPPDPPVVHPPAQARS